MMSQFFFREDRQFLPEPAILRIAAVFSWVGPQHKSWTAVGDEVEHIWHTGSVGPHALLNFWIDSFGSLPSLVLHLYFYSQL